MLLVVLLGLAPGCRTASDSPWRPQVTPDWRLQSGQAVWRPGAEAPELAGELLVATAPDGACFLEFTKTPLTLVVAMRDRTRWRIEFPNGEKAVGGRGKPPWQLTWLYLQQALAGEHLPRQLAFEQTSTGDWRLENRRTGETVKGYLSP